MAGSSPYCVFCLVPGRRCGQEGLSYGTLVEKPWAFQMHYKHSLDRFHGVMNYIFHIVNII